MSSGWQVLQRCAQIAAQTEVPGEVTRRFLTPPMRVVHATIRHWMEQAGMVIRVDAAGNIVGRRPATSGVSPKVLILGSHLDTVPNAGMYDGILGVMIGLAVVESLTDEDLPFAIDVIGFSEEEGVRYSLPYIGSRAVAGSFDPLWLERVDSDGVSLREAIIAFGLDPKEICKAAYDPHEVLGFIEAHIEQGPVLERLGLPVASVSSIVGQSRLGVCFRGEAGHAGTMPMAMRHDALVGASKWILKVQELALSVEGLRATVGRMAVSPNASNVIPDRVELSLDVRHEQDSVRLAAIDQLLSHAEAIGASDGLRFEVLHRGDSGSVAGCPRLESLLRETIAAQGTHCCVDGNPLSLASGAGHDAVVMGASFPMAMLFIRHPGGISHHPDERVDQCDVEVAIQVLVDFVKRLAHQECLA